MGQSPELGSEADAAGSGLWAVSSRALTARPSRANGNNLRVLIVRLFIMTYNFQQIVRSPTVREGNQADGSDAV